MMFDPIQSNLTIARQAVKQKEQPPGSAGKQIVSSFQKMFNEANKDQLHAEEMATEMMAGRNKDIAGTLIAMEKADVSSRMLMAVRNKIVNAYEEIMRMPV
jgi:flagellar hook-basal body complex protein FliE